MSESHHEELSRPDWAIACVLGILGLVGAFAAFAEHGLIEREVWFQGDTGRAFADMIWHDANHYRTSVHPLFVMMTLPPCYIMRKLFGIEAYDAVRIVSVTLAFAWTAGLYLLFRLSSVQRTGAVLFALLGAMSSASIFWFTTSETYAWGSLSIVGALVFAALSERRSFPAAAYVVIMIATASVTITNGVVGAVATLANLRWKRTLLAGIAALVVLFALSLLQKAVFPTASLLLSSNSEEATYLMDPKLGGPLRAGSVFLFHSIVMPALRLVDHNGHPMLSVQMSLPGSGSIVAVLAVVIWGALLILGLWAAVTLKTGRNLRLTVCLSLLAQFLLHLVYGDETFLYSLHYMPLLLVLSSFVLQTRLRNVGMALGLVLLPLIASTNIQALSESRKLIAPKAAALSADSTPAQN